MKTHHMLLGIIAVTCSFGWRSHAFCGFYVAKADTKLFNQASKVVLVRDEDRTVLTMANDYQGELQEFAIVIPVPTFLERGQIHVTAQQVLDHLDAYTAPRLVEYFDRNPCEPVVLFEKATRRSAALSPAAQDEASALGVTIEAQYTVGEYDILILSAQESRGLETWLRNNDYRIPEGASRVLESYIKQDMRFFVAKVNLEEQAQLGYTYLRPIQVAYESPKFMLPIRLGTVNADGPQELFVFALTRKGRVETTNYRTVKIPSDVEIPLFVKNEFEPFYLSMFDRLVEKEDMRVVFLEYAWNMAWCDPCAADPLSQEELRELGVFWLADHPRVPGGPIPMRVLPVYVTRLHLRYDAEHFPEDLVFQVTGDQSNFQGRYIMHHPWQGKNKCPELEPYVAELRQRKERWAQNLARLTGWDINEIRAKMDGEWKPGQPDKDDKWWKRLWNNEG